MSIQHISNVLNSASGKNEHSPSAVIYIILI